MRYSDPRLVDSLAAAYALGTLAGPARRRFERLAGERGDVALAVAAWEQRLGGLAQAVPPKAAPDRVWRAIEQRTRPAASRSARAWWLPAGFGLGGLVAGMLATFALLYVTPALFLSADQVALRSGGKLPQSYVGLLTDSQGNGKLLVSSLRHGRTMTVKVIGPIAPPAAGQRLVLWALPSQGAPFVLGDVPASGSATSQLPGTSEQLLSKVTKLAVSLESVPAPTAPATIVFSGNCAKLW